jgi:NADH dehydrogenase
MILETGATGYIGRHLLPRLEELGVPLRILLRPSDRSPSLPPGIKFEVALASLTDRRGLRAALVGVEQVIHLASAESSGFRGDLERVDVRGTELLAAAAEDADIQRIVFLSHLGASRSSAYPLLRAKSAAEGYLEASAVPHLILRCGLVFGRGDRFTCPLASLIRLAPFVFPLPSGGEALVHPLWIEDLTTCLQWVLEEPELRTGRFELGGAEHLTLRQCSQQVLTAAGLHRILVSARPPYLRGLIWMLERMLPRPGLTTHSLDYLASNRTAPLDSMVRFIGLKPARFIDKLSYLEGGSWRWAALRRE